MEKKIESRLTKLETLYPIIHKDLEIIKEHVSLLKGFKTQVTTTVSIISIAITAAWNYFTTNHS